MKHSPDRTLLASILLLTLTVSGCLRSEGAAQTAPEPPPVQDAAAGSGREAERSTDQTARQRELEAWLISSAQRQFDAGLEALQDGEVEEARALFESALDTYLNSSILDSGSPELHAAMNKLIDDVADLELDLQDVPGQHPEAVPSPVEDLANITTTLTPEEAERELAKVRPDASAATYDIPMVVNDKVLAWIDIFQNSRPFRESFIGGYQRYGWYEPMITRILREEGVPLDLIYLAYLESTYKTSAYSRARAKGIWQFMTATGRMYGLTVDRYTDERSHPEKSTRAAARYLRDLHDEFGDWHLAMAAYNTGAGNVRKAMRRSGKNDFWSVSETRYMRTETKNFVPAILALALMSKNPARYGFGDLQHNDPLEYDRVEVDGPTMLSLVAKLSGSTESEIQFLNPHLRLGVTPPGRKNYEVFVPRGRGATFMASYEALPEADRGAKIATVHRVRKGETLASIARRYGTSMRELASANGIRNPHRIAVGMELTVPTFPGSGTTLAAAPVDVDRTASYHVVRRGDTLSRISFAYGVPLRSLLAWNGLGENSILRPGQRIAVKATPSPTVSASAPPVSGGTGTHRVRRGETLAKIAQSYGTTVSRIADMNGISDPHKITVGMRLKVPGSSDEPVAEAPPPAAEVEGARSYVVRRGDTLHGISKSHGVRLSDLLDWNGLSPRSVIYPGMRLALVPPEDGASGPTTYRIRHGDNLFRIAQKFRTSVEQIMVWNNMPDDRIRVGDVLTIYGR